MPIVLDDVLLREPNLLTPGSKPVGNVKINTDSRFGSVADIAYIFSQGHPYDELARGELITRSGAAITDKTGLVVDGATDRGLGTANRSLFTGNNFTAIFKFEVGAISNNWTTVIGTDGSLIKLIVTTRSTLYTVQTNLYIAGSYRLVSAQTINVSLPIGASLWGAVTFNNPDTYCYVANDNPDDVFHAGTYASYGASMDDRGGGLIFGASDTSGATPSTGKVELLYLSNTTFSENELNLFKRDPYQFLIPA